MTKLYVVCAECGEYSDRDVWIDAAYLDEEMAEEHARLANGEARRLSNLEASQRFEEAKQQRYGVGNSRNSYEVVETELRTEVPK